MKNVKKMNLSEISNKQTLSIDQLSKIIGGADMDDACASNVCDGGALETNTKYCNDASICTSGITTDKPGSDKPTCASNVEDKPTCVSAL